MMSNDLIMAFGSIYDQCKKIESELAFVANIDSSADVDNVKRAYELSLSTLTAQRDKIMKTHPEAMAFLGAYRTLRDAKRGN